MLHAKSSGKEGSISSDLPKPLLGKEGSILCRLPPRDAVCPNSVGYSITPARYIVHHRFWVY